MAFRQPEHWHCKEKAYNVANFPIQRAAFGGGGGLPRAGGPDGPGRVTLLAADLIAEYAGPMVLLDGAGTVLMANALAEPIVSALRGPMGGGLRAMLDEVLIHGGVPSKRFQLPISAGEGVFDITLLPEDGSEDGAGGGDVDQGPSRILLLARDSTFDVNFGRALVASRQLFKDLVSCSTDFVWETDADGCFAQVS